MQTVKIYKGIACLEAHTPEGPLWWYQPGNLAYSPVPIASIQKVVAGKVGGRKVLAVPVVLGGHETLIALNIPRTDVWGLQERGLLPQGWSVPVEERPTYAAAPKSLP